MTSSDPSSASAENSSGAGASGVPGSDSQESAVPGIGEQVAAAARKSGLDSLVEGEGISTQALLAAIGGVRGIFEAVVPGLLFVIVYSATRDLPLAAGIAVGIAVIATIARLLGKATLTAALSGLAGVVLSAGLALVTGKAENNFLIGLFTNAGYGAALIISIFVGWPLIGLIAGYLMGDGTAWRANRSRRRVLTWLTWMWVGMFAARIIVQLPLYLRGEDGVTALGFARVGMGLPLYVPLLVVTVLVARSLWRSGKDSDNDTKKSDAPTL